MIKNYIKIAIRNLRRQFMYTFVNLAGLAVGMACCLLIVLYLNYEFSYDAYHEKGARIHRVVVDYKTADVMREQGYTQGILAPLLVDAIPEVEAAVRLTSAGGVLSRNTLSFTESDLLVADAGIFSVFSFELLRGDPATVLVRPESIVLTESLAQKYFGDSDPVGQTLLYNNDRELTVTGIVKTPPAQSHFTFDGLISMSSIENATAPSWMFGEWLSTFVQTYVLVDKNARASVVEQKMAGLIDREAGELMRQANRWVTLLLEPLDSIYLTSSRDGLGVWGNLANLYLFGCIAAFILLIACINFTNLATARAMLRAREVGVRKTLGAARMHLVWQFLGEALFFSVVALLLALGLVWFSLPAFNQLAGKSMAWSQVLSVDFMPWLVLLVGVVTLLAGAYPAAVLSGFRPAQVLKGKLGHWRGGERLRKGLVVFQFAVSVGLIVATAIVYLQLQYMKTSQLGFDKEQVLVLSFGGDPQVLEQLDTIKNELAALPGVLAVSASQTTPGGGLPQSGGSVWLTDGTEQDISLGLYMVDYDFMELYHMEMAAGRTFDEALATDSIAAYILNETAVRQIGFTSPEAILGKRASFWGLEGQVVGVAKDIHHFALQTRVSPMALRVDYDNLGLFSVRLAPNRIPEAIGNLEEAWASLAPHRPFEYQFLDDVFDAQYQAEERFGRVFVTFAFLAMFIACLGLFGLATFMVQRRTKEIGIRKVVGASTQKVLVLLSKDYASLVLLGILIATPIVYFAMQRWLEDFPYRINIPWWIFAGAGLLALAIAWVTISLQTFRAANKNPVESLRYE